jgi:hypothetical protein
MPKNNDRVVGEVSNFAQNADQSCEQSEAEFWINLDQTIGAIIGLLQSISSIG